MSNGVDNRLNYLKQTKNIIKNAINETGGNLDSSAPFSDYPAQVQEIINTRIIPQSTLNELVVMTDIINGEEVQQ